MQVTVIIPTYNRHDRVAQAIESVLTQTHQDFELLVVDDGSNDHTSEIINRYKDKRIRAFYHTANYGQNAALNTGVVNARGELIAFNDSDDMLAPNYIERFLLKFREDSELSCVYSKRYLFKTQTKEQKIAMNFWAEGYIYDIVLAQGFMSHMGTLMVKRECFKKTGLFDIYFTNHQDDDFCFNLARHFKVGLIPEPLAVEMNYGLGDRVTDNRDSYCLGFERLIEKHKSDIIKVCGHSGYINHKIKAAELRIRNNNPDEAYRHLNDSKYLMNKFGEVPSRLNRIIRNKPASQRRIAACYSHLAGAKKD